jgi:hypothetical protein
MRNLERLLGIEPERETSNNKQGNQLQETRRDEDAKSVEVTKALRARNTVEIADFATAGTTSLHVGNLNEQSSESYSFLHSLRSSLLLLVVSIAPNGVVGGEGKELQTAPKPVSGVLNPPAPTPVSTAAWQLSPSRPAPRFTPVHGGPETPQALGKHATSLPHLPHEQTRPRPFERLDPCRWDTYQKVRIDTAVGITLSAKQHVQTVSLQDVQQYNPVNRPIVNGVPLGGVYLTPSKRPRNADTTPSSVPLWYCFGPCCVSSGYQGQIQRIPYALHPATVRHPVRVHDVPVEVQARMQFHQ